MNKVTGIKFTGNRKRTQKKSYLCLNTIHVFLNAFRLVNMLSCFHTHNMYMTTKYCQYLCYDSKCNDAYK